MEPIWLLQHFWQSHSYSFFHGYSHTSAVGLATGLPRHHKNTTGEDYAYLSTTLLSSCVVCNVWDYVGEKERSGGYIWSKTHKHGHLNLTAVFSPSLFLKSFFLWQHLRAHVDPTGVPAVRKTDAVIQWLWTGDQVKKWPLSTSLTLVNKEVNAHTHQDTHAYKRTTRFSII